MTPMNQQPDPHETDDNVDQPPVPADSGTDQVAKTRKYLWVIGAGLGIYLIGSGLLEMLTSTN